MISEQAASDTFDQSGPRLSREMEDEVYGQLGALLGMLEVLSIDVIDPLAPRQRRFVDDALRCGDKLRARVEALVTLLSDQQDQRFRRAEYSLRRLIDHAIRGASWAANAKGVALELPEEGGAWQSESVCIDAARVDRALRGLTDTLVAAVGERGRVLVRVELGGPLLRIVLRGQPAQPALGAALELSALLLLAWQRVFALQGGSLQLERDTLQACVELPRVDARGSAREQKKEPGT